MLSALTNSDGLPALERMMQFTAQRHRIILNNIANLSTPGFQPHDVAPEAFQAQLAEALDARRFGQHAPLAVGFEESDRTAGTIMASAGGALVPMTPAHSAHSRATDALPLRSSSQVQVLTDRLILHPEAASDNVMFHDGNDRSVERVMQSLVENFMAFRTAAQLMRSRLDIINTAIRERV